MRPFLASEVVVGKNVGRAWEDLASLPATSALWMLSTEVLELICYGCQKIIDMGSNRTNHSIKFRWTRDSAHSIVQCRKYPGCLTRRMDFVCLRDFFDNDTWPTERLYDLGFKSSLIDWLTLDSDAPPVCMWAGYDMSEMSWAKQLCLFARALRDDCWTAIKGGMVGGVHEGRLTDANVIRLLDAPYEMRASSYKGRLVWVADNADLDARLEAAWTEDASGMEGFFMNWAVGRLHVVESSDVTNSKLTLKPSVLAGRPSRHSNAPASSSLPSLETWRVIN